MDCWRPPPQLKSDDHCIGTPINCGSWLASDGGGTDISVAACTSALSFTPSKCQLFFQNLSKR